MSEHPPVAVDRVSDSSATPSSRLENEPAVDVALETPRKEKPAASSPDDADSAGPSLQAVAVAAQPRKSEASASSLRPVGIDVPPPPAGFADLLGPPVARRPRVALVIGSLVVCSVILAAAGVRVAQRNARARSMVTSSTAAATATPLPPPAAVDPGAREQEKTPPPSGTPSSPEAPAVWSDSFPGTETPQRAVVAAPASPTTGTLRLRRPAQPGSVWLDGTRLKATSTVVTCGLHQIRVGARSRTREVIVPCGAEVSIAR